MSLDAGYLSTLVQDQFPSFYREDGPEFIAFVEAYYEYLEQTGQTLQISRSLPEQFDVDTSTGLFLEQFKQTYLSGIPGQLASDSKLTIKHIYDFYAAKGSARAVELLFRILFDDAASVRYPSEDVLRPSDAKFVRPRYIEVYAPSLTTLRSLEGREIIGATSGAKAFVESIATKLLNNIKVHVLFLSSLQGNFLREEIIAPSDTGIQDNMPVITGSLSSINITLGGSNNAVGDTFKVSSTSGKQGLARVTSIANSTGLIVYRINDESPYTNIASLATQFSGGYGFSQNTQFTEILVNDNHLVVNNVINIAQTYSNSSLVDNAQFYNHEFVIQPLERITFLSGQAFTTVYENWIASSPNAKSPLIKGYNANAQLIGTGYVVGHNLDGDTGTLTISTRTGSFSYQNELAITKLAANHDFQSNEPIDEENLVSLTLGSVNGTLSIGDTIKGANSGANGIVNAIVGSVYTVNGSFGTFDNLESVYKVGNTSANATIQTSSITTTGANGVISNVISNTAIAVAAVVGAFNPGLKIKGRRTNAKATIDAGGVVDTGVSDIFAANGYLSTSANGHTNAAVLDTFSNQTIVSVSIGFGRRGQDANTELYELGLANSISIDTNLFAGFVQNTAAYIYGTDSNTYANVVTVGTGSGSTFKIGTIENEESLTLYTDFVGDNNVMNVSFLDCVIDGGNSGVGFLDSVNIISGGTGYTNNQVITFDTGGPGGGEPITSGFATIITDGSGVIISTTVTDPGAGYYTSSDPTLPDNGGGTDATVVGNFDFGYGFIKDADGDYTTILDNVLTRFQGNVGSITSLSEINPGNNYNFDPFVSVYTKGIAKYDRRDLVLNLSSKPQPPFIVGEEVTQIVTNSGQSLGVADISLTYANGSSIVGTTTLFEDNDVLFQVVNSTVNAIGTVYATNSTHVSIKDAKKREFVGGSYFYIDTTNTAPFSASVPIRNLRVDRSLNQRYANANVTSVQVVSQTQTAQGQVYLAPTDSNTVHIRRLSFSVGFNNVGNVVGGTSGTTVSIDNIIQDLNTRPIGDNFNLIANTAAADGIVTGVEIVDSGFGYSPNSPVTLISANTLQNIVVSGVANVSTTGIGEGTWLDQASFLNTKYLHDNEFHQEYSYVVRSGLSLDKYRDILLRLNHVAGTVLFAEVFKQSKLPDTVLTVGTSDIVLGSTDSNNEFTEA